MIQQLLDRSFVLRHMKDFAGLLEKEIKLQQQGDRKALDRKSKTGVSVADLQETIKRLDQTTPRRPARPTPIRFSCRVRKSPAPHSRRSSASCWSGAPTW